ncbi:MAG: iron permease FTR1, partial [Selenomonadaceae bacterium]|nr:iron permease FTR1 [Selenomonadaceae bacterium]
LFTSVVMYLLAVTFAGGGVRELQEGGVISQSPIESLPIPTIDVLGIYPTVETFGIQIALLALGIGAFLYRRRQQQQEEATA